MKLTVTADGEARQADHLRALILNALDLAGLEGHVEVHGEQELGVRTFDAMLEVTDRYTEAAVRQEVEDTARLDTLFEVPAVPPPVRTALVHLECQEDLDAFAQLLGRPIYPGTRTIRWEDVA